MFFSFVGARWPILKLFSCNNLNTQGFVYPENVAFPVGGPGFPRYAVIQIHYNNPERVSGQ